MAIATSTAILIGAAVAAAGTGAQIATSQSAKKQSRRQADEERRRQEKLQGEFQAQRATQESESAERRVRTGARRRQRAVSRAGTSRADQLLTGPAGVVAQAPGVRKTLLGA